MKYDSQLLDFQELCDTFLCYCKGFFETVKKRYPAPVAAVLHSSSVSMTFCNPSKYSINTIFMCIPTQNLKILPFCYTLELNQFRHHSHDSIKCLFDKPVAHMYATDMISTLLRFTDSFRSSIAAL